MHGTGGRVLPDILGQIGISSQMVVVDEQFQPDPDFPTVPFPNPEENGALDLAMKSAEANGRDLVIANDPDADRFSAAQKVHGLVFLHFSTYTDYIWMLMDIEIQTRFLVHFHWQPNWCPSCLAHP